MLGRKTFERHSERSVSRPEEDVGVNVASVFDLLGLLLNHRIEDRDRVVCVIRKACRQLRHT